MDLAQLLSYLQANYPELITESALDEASLLAIGENVLYYYTLNEELSPAWYRPLADYFFLKRVRAVMAPKFDASIKGNSYSLSQQYKSVQEMYKEAYAAVSWLVEGDGSEGQPNEDFSHLEPFEIYYPFLRDC